MPAPSIPDLVTDPAALAAMLDGHRAALLVIDVQVDFAAPDGAMAALGADLSAVAPALRCIAALIAAARRHGLPRAYLRVETRPETDSSAIKLFYQRRGEPAALAVCRAGTPGARYYGVTPRPGDIEVVKSRYSGFFGTDLEAQLRRRRIDTLIVTGLTTECCVDSSVRDAFERGFSVFIAADACATYGDADHRAALANLAKSFALPTLTAALLAAWQAAAAGPLIDGAGTEPAR